MVVHVAFVSGELRSHASASSDPVCEPVECFCAVVGVSRLLPSFHLVSWNVIFVVLGPSVIVIAVDLERFTEGNVAFAAPAGETLPAGMRVVSLLLCDDSLDLEPVDSQCNDVVDVGLAESSTFRQPFRVHSLLIPFAHARIELDACERAVGVPSDLDRWVSFLVYVVSKASRWLDVLLSGAQAHSEEPPRS